MLKTKKSNMGIIEKLEKGITLTGKEYEIIEENLLAIALFFGVDMETVKEQAQSLIIF